MMACIKRDKNKVYIGENSKNTLAEASFILTADDKIIIDRLYVSEDLKGRGIALELVEKVVEYDRQEHDHADSVQSYPDGLLSENKKFKDVV